MNIETLNLHPDHYADLRKSGLNDETIGLLNVYSLVGSDIPKSLGWNPEGVTSLLAFPYHGAEEFTRYKVFPAFKDREGHTVKYLQRRNTGSHLYVLPSVEDILCNPSIPLAIAEGEKKTAALVQAGIPTVGIGGVWNWLNGRTHKPIEDIERMAWVERSVHLYFDSDIWHRPDLLRGVYAFAKELEERGALVQAVIIDQKGREKCGIDDLLHTEGTDILSKFRKITLGHKAFSAAAQWWKIWKNKRLTSTANNNLEDLRNYIHSIRKTSSQILQSFEKKQSITKAAISYLENSGALYVTPEGHGYYFCSQMSTLTELGSDDFIRLLSDLSGLNPTETEFKYLSEQIQTETKIRGKRTDVYQLAHYSESQKKLYVSDFQGGMFVLDGKTISKVHNGEDGILFVTTSSAKPYEYLSVNQRIKDADLDHFLEPINCDSHYSIAPQEMKYLIRIWFLSIFFPELHPTKMIPAFIGPKGATKTTTALRIGIQLLGDRFNVGHLEAADRGEQGFIATVCGKPFAVFDNADAPIKWLPDRLATFATGHYFELRELYTTNKLGVYKPMAHIAITSRDPYFRRPDVAERLLLIKLERPSSFIPEAEVVKNIMEHRNSVWSSLLDTLNWTLNALQLVSSAPRMSFRMADYASFGWRLSKALGGEEKAGHFQELLRKLEKEQAAYTTEEDSVTMCLGHWLEVPSNLNRIIDSGLLFTELSHIARREGLILPKTAPAFGKRLRLAKKEIEMILGIKITDNQTTHTSLWKFTRPTSLTESGEDALPTHPSPQNILFDDGEEVQEVQNSEL